MEIRCSSSPAALQHVDRDASGEQPVAADQSAPKEETQIHAEVRFLPVDGCTVLNPTAWVYLWGTVERGQHAPLCDECRAVYSSLLAVARAALPSPAAEVSVECWPPEPALFESSRGVDEVRLRIRAVATAPIALDAWTRALHAKLFELGIQVTGIARTARA